MMEIHVEVDKAGVERGLSVLAHELEDWHPAWMDIRDDFMEMEARRFAEQPWAPHGPVYLAWDDPATGERFASSQILVRTGGLRDSLTTPATMLEVSNQSMLLGTRYHARSNTGRDVPVAALTDRGFVARGRISIRTATGYARPKIRVAVPPRKLIDVQSGDTARWGRITERWVKACIAKAGL